MEVEVLREDSGGFEIQISGEDHTFLNLLTRFLNENSKVEHAAYKIEHPLVGVPKLFFKLKGVSKIKEIPIRKIKGVGPKTADQLEGAEITTVSQLVLNTPEKLSERTGIALKLASKYMDEAKKMVPEDRFGYRATLIETLAEVSKTLKNIKKEV